MDNNLEIIRNFAIEGEPKYSLIECLELSENRHRDLLEQCDLENELENENIPELLYNEITDKFIFNYTFFNDNQDEAFFNLIENRKFEISNFFLGAYFFLFAKGIAYYFYHDEKIYCIIPDEIIELYNKRNIEGIENEKSINAELYKYTIALCNLYGIYPSCQFVEVYNTYHKAKITEEDFIYYVKIMDERQMYFSIDVDEDENTCLVFSGEEEDDDEIMESLFEYDDIEFFMPTRSLINHYYKESFEDTYEFIRFKDYVLDNKLLPPEQHKEDFFDELRFSISMDRHLQELLLIAYNYGIDLENLPDKNKFVKQILDMNNHQRKWVFRGNKPIDIFDQEYKEPYQVPYPIKVGRNAPCPCGSDKKYKKCCGQQ